MLMHTVYWYDTYVQCIFYKIQFFEESKINLSKEVIPKTEYM